MLESVYNTPEVRKLGKYMHLSVTETTENLQLLERKPKCTYSVTRIHITRLTFLKDKKKVKKE